MNTENNKQQDDFYGERNIDFINYLLSEDDDTKNEKWIAFIKKWVKEEQAETVINRQIELDKEWIEQTKIDNQ